MATTYTQIEILSCKIKNVPQMSVFTFFGNPGFGAARLRQFLLSQSRFLAAAVWLVDPFRNSDTRILDRNYFQWKTKCPNPIRRMNSVFAFRPAIGKVLMRVIQNFN